MGAIQAETESRWLEAAKSHEQELNSQTSKASAAKSWEKIGFCYNLASRQADSAEEFKKLRQLAVEAYETAARLFSKELTPETEGKSEMCLALSEYARSWLASNSSEKKEALDRCRALGQGASAVFKKSGDKLNCAKTCIILSQCLYDFVVITSEGEEKIRVVKEGLESASEAISVLSNLDEKDELVNAFSVASLLSWHFANLSEKEEERKESAKRCLDYAENAVVLSKHTANTYSSSMSMWAKALSTFYFGEKLEDSLEYTKEMYQKVSITGDNYFKGIACYLVAYINNWRVFNEEDTDKTRQICNEIIEYSEAAIRHFQSVCQISNIAEAYLFYVEAYSSLSKEPSVNQAEKLNFSKQAVRNGEKGLEYAVRSGSVDAIFDALHALSKAYHYNAKLETEKNEKIQLLRKALTNRKECDKIAEQSFANNFWLIGNGLVYAAQIEADLAGLEENENTKTALLKDALHDIESGVSYSNKWLTTCFVPSLVAVAANYENTLGGMLTERYLQTHEKESLTKANKAYTDAAGKYKEVGLPSRVAESYWKIASNFDVSSDYQEAAENFENAFAGYKAAATKIHEFNDFFLDYASYMKAWSEIEMAKRAHNDEKYETAMNHYEKSSQLLRQSKSWMYLSQNFYAWSLLEQAEDLSRKENSKESIEAFQEAIKFLQESKRILSLKLEGIEKKDEKDLVERLIEVTDTRNEYSCGRIAIEEAKDLDKQGDHIASSEKYNKAATIFQKISIVETGEAAKEAKPLVYLCQAWQKMTMAEATSNPTMYKEAAELFSQANQHSSKESASLMALGHSSFCKALEAGTEFETTQTMETYEKATRHMDAAANYYLKAGFETTSDYAKATQRLFDAYVFMESAKRDRDPAKQARFYSMAEKVLEVAAEYFIKAGYHDKTDQVQRFLRKVKEKRELTLSLGEIFQAPAITTSTATFSTISSSEKAVGLERFESADIQAKLVQHETDIKVGDTVTIEIQIVNVGKEPASLTKIENVIPAGFQLVDKPDYCKLENAHININGKRLNPLKTEEIKIALRPFKQGSIEVKPRIVCIDWAGQQIICSPEPLAYNISGAALPGRISTGFADLDNLLFGGLPENYAVILTSPSCNEREQLIKRFLDVGTKNGQTTYYIASEVGDVADLAKGFQSNFNLFVCNPRSEGMIESLPNVFKLKGVDCVTDLDIALVKSFRNMPASQTGPKRFCITIISDVLLQHHAVITRKWLSGLIPDLKSKGFTTLAVINPEMHPPEEVQAILGLFDGEIRISEKETEKGLEKVLRIRKLYNQRYLENEIALTREKLEC
ncbi:MAG: ATPase domain-containing protein [Candidatus Bathyarchaeia archaeon]